MNFIQRKQPRQQRSKQTVDIILKGAEKAIAQESGEISTNIIAKISGVSVGSLYQYFKNKDELFSSLYLYLNKITQSLLSKDAYSGNGDKSPDQLVSEGIDQLVDHFIKYQNHFRLFMKLVNRLSLYNLVISSRQASAAKVETFLINDFGMEGPRSKIIAHVIMGSCLGLIHNHLLEDDKTLNPNELKSELKKLVFAILKQELKQIYDLSKSDQTPE